MAAAIGAFMALASPEAEPTFDSNFVGGLSEEHSSNPLYSVVEESPDAKLQAGSNPSSAGAQASGAARSLLGSNSRSSEVDDVVLEEQPTTISGRQGAPQPKVPLKDVTSDNADAIVAEQPSVADETATVKMAADAASDAVPEAWMQRAERPGGNDDEELLQDQSTPEDSFQENIYTDDEAPFEGAKPQDVTGAQSQRAHGPSSFEETLDKFSGNVDASALGHFVLDGIEEEEQQKASPTIAFSEADRPPPATPCNGYKIGRAYEYTHISTIDMANQNTRTKKDGNPSQRSEKAGVKMSFRIEMVPLAAATIDRKPQMYFRMNIKDVVVLNQKVKGQNSQVEKSMRDSMKDKEQLRMKFANPFYYRQTCDLAITRVYHPKAEISGVVTMKKGIANGFSHGTRPQGHQKGIESKGGRSTNKKLAYEYNLIGTNGEQSVRYHSTGPEDKWGRAVYHSTLVSLTVRDKKTGKKTKRTPEVEASKDHGMLEAKVGKLETQNGQVSSYEENNAGGLLSSSKAKTKSEVMSMIQADGLMVRTQGAVRSSPSVGAQSAQNSRVGVKKGKESKVEIDHELLQNFQGDNFVEVTSAKHRMDMHESTLEVTDEEHLALERGRSKFNKKKLHDALLIMESATSTPSQKLSYFRHVQQHMRIHPKQTVPELEKCLRYQTKRCQNQRTRIAVCNVLGEEGSEHSQRVLTNLLQTEDKGDRMAALTGMNRLERASPDLLHSTYRVTKDKDERISNFALISLGNLVSHHVRGRVQRDIVNRVVTDKAVGEEALMGFVQNAVPPGALDLIKPRLMSKSVAVRVAAIEALTTVTPAESTELAVQQYEDTSARPVVHQMALKALRGKVTTEDHARRILGAALQHLKKASENTAVSAEKYRKAYLGGLELHFAQRHSMITGVSQPTEGSMDSDGSLHTKALVALQAAPCSLYDTTPCGLEDVVNAADLQVAQAGIKAMCLKIGATSCVLTDQELLRPAGNLWKVNARGVMMSKTDAGGGLLWRLAANVVADYNSIDKKMGITASFVAGQRTMVSPFGMSSAVSFEIQVGFLEYTHKGGVTCSGAEGEPVALSGLAKVGTNPSVKATVLRTNDKDHSFSFASSSSRAPTLNALATLTGVSEGMVGTTLDKAVSSVPPVPVTADWNANTATTMMGIAIGQGSCLATTMYQLSQPIPAAAAAAESSTSTSTSTPTVTPAAPQLCCQQSGFKPMLMNACRGTKKQVPSTCCVGAASKSELRFRGS
jgi:hypothetical protein